MTETEKLLLRDIYVQKKPYSVELKKELRSLAVKGKYNLFLFMHLGDDFIRLNVKPLFEKQFGKMHFIIQPNEVFLMELFGIPEEDYIVFDYKAFLSKLLPKESDDAVVREYTYMAIVENSVLSVPNTYEPFICWFNNMCSCKEYEEKYGKVIDLFSFIKSCLGIITNKKIDFSAVCYPTMTESLRARLASMGTSPEKVVLFLPEARSDEMIDKRIWELLAEKLNVLGYTVIENVMNEKNHIEDCLNPKFTLTELSALAMNCRAVFSLRSGLCDIFATIGEKLYVFWTKERLEGCGGLFSFAGLYNFKGKQPPVEIVLQKGEKPKIMFDGENFGTLLPNSYLPKKTSPMKSRIHILKDLADAGGILYSINVGRKKMKERLRMKFSNSLYKIRGG